MPFDGVDFVFKIHDYLVISAAVTMITAGIIAAIKKEKLAAFYLPAFLLFCFGVITNQLERFGVRFGTSTFFLANAEQPGFVFSLLILALAISNKIKDLRRGKIHALEKAEQVQILYQEKVSLFTVVSHELRTPTTNLKLFLERITKGREGDMIPSDHRMFRLMQQQIKRISRHIDNILSLSKAEYIQNNDGREVTDIRGLCVQLLSEFAEAAGQKDLVLEFERDSVKAVYAEVHRELFESMMINIIENSIKYTERGSITLSVYEKDRSAVIKLRDTGKGIAQDDIKNIFKRYYSKGDKKSFGIGLSVVQDIVKLHNGTIEAESSPGSGCVFSISLPLSEKEGLHIPPPPAESIEETSETGTGKNLQRILLVEDDINLLESMSVLLSVRFSISRAPSAAEALHLLDEMQFDLIICDILMPGMNGFEFIRKVRKDRRTAAVPFLFLTALGSHENRLQGLRLGAIDYIRKPFDSDMLAAKIAAILDSKNRFIEDYDRQFKEYLQQWKPEMQGNGLDAADEDLFKKAAQEYNLTEKQAEVFELVIKGYTNRDIARLLSISKKTVDNHLSSILKKTGASNRTQLSFEMLHIK
jgi:signal transduction histidine kinase/DNA-binding NarL/FixJ family response regulator